MSTEEQERPVSYVDLDAERSVLGACLLAPDAFPLAAALLDGAGDFYHPGHAVMWRAMDALAGRGQPTHDVVLVAAELRAMDALNAAGGTDALAALTDRIPTIAHVEDYARIVAELARARRVQGVCRRACEPTGAAQPGDYIARVMTAIERAAAVRGQSEARSLADIGREQQARMDRIRERLGAPAGLSTGIRRLDRMSSGMQPGQLVVVAGRPGMGKTSFALHLSRLSAEHTRASVVFCSMEMSHGELWTRLACAAARVNSLNVTTSSLTDDEADRLETARKRLDPLPIDVVYRPGMSAREVRAACLARHMRRHVQLVVVDHLTIMQSPPGTDRLNESRRVGRNAGAMKALAVELGCPVILLCQVNREVDREKDRRPRMSNLRESGEIEEHADAVWMLFRKRKAFPRDERIDPRECDIVVGKQRDGATGEVRVRFIEEFTKFEDPDTDAAGLADWSDNAD